MYNELQYQVVRDKSAEYKRLIARWNGRAKDMLIGLGISILVFLTVGILNAAAGLYNVALTVAAPIAITLYLGAHMYCKYKVNKYHAKRVIAETYLMSHKHDYKNIDNAPHKEI